MLNDKVMSSPVKKDKQQSVTVSDKFPVIKIEYEVPGSQANPWRTCIIARDGKEAVNLIIQILRKPIKILSIEERAAVVDAIAPSMLDKIRKLYPEQKKSLSQKLGRDG
jgi:hypothetical protein